MECKRGICTISSVYLDDTSKNLITVDVEYDVDVEYYTMPIPMPMLVNKR